MALTCSRCSRVNPVDASYCYYDGVVLHGQANGRSPAPRSQAFPAPLIFPAGRSCRTLDELALACDALWSESRELLRQGTFEKFFGGIGRADLALAAREAAHFPDLDRGLDQFLASLPTDVLSPPALRVEPQELSLGVLRMGVDRVLSLRLENQGARLLYGSVTADDCPWITLGDAPGAPQKLFQFGDALTLPLRIHGQRLRASAKPLEGKLQIESNGGQCTVIVRAEVAVKPFPDGILAGARAPREVAEKARSSPKEAALLFETGAVARWYKDNGWSYPVQAPSASGLGAVQQFFEALGLTAPPRVELSEQAIDLYGTVGESLRHTLDVRTQEKRPVWAHAVSDVPWLEVGRPRLNGRSASIALAVPAVPDREGETLTATLTVTSNGNQQFQVPVTLHIGGSLDFARRPQTNPPLATVVPLAQPVVATPMALRSRGGWPPWVHALSALLLVLVLALLVILDLGSAPAKPREEPPREFVEAVKEKAPRPDTKDELPGVSRLIDTDPRIGIGYNEQIHRFGLVSLKQRDRDNPEKFKKLTSDDHGGNNNTIVRINGSDYIFGWPPGKQRGSKLFDKEQQRYLVTWEFPQRIEVTQSVMLVPGDQNVLDTCLVRYTIRNRSTLPVTVGLRIMLDTYIGSNDGVPFSVPGRKPPLVEDLSVIKKLEIPDYVQALEFPDPGNPGTVAHLGLKGFQLPHVALEEPDEVVLCRWAGQNVRWKWEFEPMNKDPKNKDSCVVLYWPYLPMNADESRDMAFTYGLNAISSETGPEPAPDKPKLGLFAPGTVRASEVFTVTGYIKRPQLDQPVELELPPGFELLDDNKAQAVKPGGDYSQVSWRVKAGATGQYGLAIHHGPARVQRELTVANKKSIFD